MRLLAN